jgi:hemoglobin-like flavoprotein
MIAAMQTDQAIVLDSWAKLKTVPDYDGKAGVLLFQHLFRRCPEAKTLFGFPIDLDVESDSMISSRRFATHAKYFIEMLDRALSMLEAKSLQENMKQLGALHAGYGVKPEFFPIMGDSLFLTLEETLPAGTWTKESKEAWETVFEKLSNQMITSMRNSLGRKK